VQSLVQDFEKNTEAVSGGFGLIDPNGPTDGVVDHGANRGLDTNADAIEAYVKTIAGPRASAALDAASVVRGRAVFNTAGCVQCHSGPKWSVSKVTYALPASSDPGVVITDGQIVSIGGSPLLRDVGSFSASGPLEIRGAAPSMAQTAQGANGYNPPSLLGIARTAPYFHDGRFTRLDDIIAFSHGTPVPLTPPQGPDLVNFLRSIDENTPPFPTPP
jgi:cytochrome c peroxidase